MVRGLISRISAARVVEVTVTVVHRGNPDIVHDGPGFSPAALATAIAAFDTSKPSGTGLGLYTTERLILASGGTLTRGNGVDGGAVVRIRLASSS